MFNPLELKKRFIQSQIEKSFSDELEKAHNVGDPHPKNPDWVWTEYAPGKFDYRKKNGRHWKDNGGNTSDATWNDKHSGSKSPSFEGAVKADDLKVGDKLVSKSGKTLTVIGVSNKTANSVDIGVKFNNPAIGDGIHWMTFNRSGYLGAKKVDESAFNNSKEQEFKQNFKDASDDVLQKVVDGKIQATDSEKKWAQDILDDRKASDAKSAAGKKVIDLLKVSSSKYTDIDKVVAWKTDKGNWAIDYDGADTGLVINGSKLSEKDLKDAGVKVEGNHGGSSDNHSVKLSGSEYKVKDDNGKDVTFASYIPKSLSNSDPRDKVAQKAGFKDYKEMKAHQDYVTAKNLLKKRSTKAQRAFLEREVERYEKEHADVIKRIAEKKDDKKNTDSSGRAVYYKTLAERFDKTGKCESTDTLIGVYKNNNPSKNIEAARALRKYIMKDLNYRDDDDWTKTLNEYKKQRLNANKAGDKDAYKAYDCAYQAVKDRIAKDAKNKDNA